MKTCVMNKGYRVTCTSWENDGDYYNTNFVTVDSKELALAIRELCLLSVSKYKNGIGNSRDFTPEVKDKILEFMKAHRVLFEYCGYNKEDDLTDDKIVNIWSEVHTDLLGSSEFYVSRVCESVSVVYLEEDVFAEIIE